MSLMCNSTISKVLTKFFNTGYFKINSFRSKGVYNRVRLVLDLKDFYYLAAEYMDCNGCKATYIAYNEL